jgi:hypothetical protein
MKSTQSRAVCRFIYGKRRTCARKTAVPRPITYPELLDKTISLALKRQREKDNLNFSFESNILQGFKGGRGGKLGAKS